MTYDYKTAIKESLIYFGGDELAANVVVTKYLLTSKDGEYLEASPDQMHHRLAKEFHRIEMKYENPMSEEEIFDLLAGFHKIVPQGSPMAGIGNNTKLQSISNCFVIPSPEDSYGGILATDQRLVQIAKRRGGVGFDISTIRPKGLSTANAAKTTDGIEVFMDRFSNSCREVAQGGRRGALMLTISVHHPQIRDFVKIKRDLGRITGANISIRASDEFMNAVQSGTNVHLRWPVDSVDPVISEYIDARVLWHEIIAAAHATAEPGLLFWDTAKRMTPSDIYSDEGFTSSSTNPCGEIILSPYDSCRLMLINLTGFVKNRWKKNSKFDFKSFSETVQKAQRLMDDMIDIEIEKV
jgi:ribonucleoside-diphosphate reductase alpha chain